MCINKDMNIECFRWNEMIWIKEYKKRIVYSCNFSIGESDRSLFELFSHLEYSLDDFFAFVSIVEDGAQSMIKVMGKLSAKLHLLGEESAKAMPESIGELSDVDFLSFVLLDNVHSVLDLFIQVKYDSILSVDFGDLSFG